jgi:enhancing lycopene biosynthesis protein 2
MAVRVGVVLSGCGYLDGSEITEAVSILVALDRRGAQAICCAPDINQSNVINHITREPQRTQRNVLEESSRISRGNIRDIAKLRSEELDALIFPGGFGAAKNLSDFESKGVKATINPHVARLITEMHEAKKPIGLACIAPVLAAAILGHAGKHPRLTIGTDAATARAINDMGGTHQDTSPADIAVDQDNLLVTTPCYMNDVGPWTVFEGAEKMVEQVLRMAGDTASLIRKEMANFREPLPSSERE